MTLPRFLDCAFTLLFDEYQRLGQDMVSAMEKLQDWQSGKPRREEKTVETAAVRNAESMRQLQTMMLGVRKA